MPTPSPDQQGAAPQGGGAPPPPTSGGGQGPPSAGQANGLQKLLADWYNVSKQVAAADPRTASGMEKVAQGIQEAQSALVTPPQPTPVGQNPPA